MTIAGVLLLMSDALLVWLIAFAVVGSLAPGRSNGRVIFVLTAIAAMLVVFASALVLSFAHELSSIGFVGLHFLVATVAVPLAIRRRRVQSYETRKPEDRSGWSIRIAVTLLCITGAILLVQAILAEPLNYDSNTYRLTRIGYWLQEKSIASFPTNDARHNYMPYLADILMLWLSCFFSKGFPMVNAVQTLSGAVLAASTWELARSFGFRPLTCAAVVAVMLGMPNVSLQLVSSQTDVCGSALAIAGLMLLRRAILTADLRAWVWTGIAYGLAIAAKGVVFFWGAGLVMLLLVWMRSARYPLRRALSHLSLCTVACLLVGSPPYVRNIATFGNPLVPPSQSTIGAAAPGVGRGEFLAKNMTAFSWQLFEPHSNPLIPDAITRPAYEWLAAAIDTWPAPPDPKFKPLFALAKRSYGFDAPNEDVATTGVVPLALAVTGLLILLLLPGAMDTRHRSALVWLGLSAIAFLLCFGLTESWTPHRFRYFVLMSPVMALLSGAAIERLTRPKVVDTLASVAFFLAVTSLGLMSYKSYHHGWLTIINPARSPHTAITARMRAFVDRLPRGPLNIGLALRENTWIAPFFRERNDIHFTFVPINEIRSSGIVALMSGRSIDAVILNAAPGLEVPMRCPRLETSEFTLVAPPGSRLFPPVIRPSSGFFADGWTEQKFVFRLENIPDDRTLNFAGSNPTSLSRSISVTLDRVQVQEADIPAGAAILLNIPVKAGTHELLFQVAPAFVPSERADSPDSRSLGIRFARLEGYSVPASGD